MAKQLACVPADVKLRCGVSTTVRVKTSDAAPNVKITALGYDKTVASLHPTEGTTNNDGYLEITVTCAQEGVSG